VWASQPSAVLYRPDTTPATAPSASQTTGAPLIPGTSASAVIRPSGTVSSRVVQPAHSPGAFRKRYVWSWSCGSACPITVTGARRVI
jgi:hypothetical protein